jgi:hypothetical protein
MAFAQVERERVNAYILPIFQRYGFRDDEGKPITNPERLYTCTDEERVAAYYEECDRAHREHGFTGPKGHCPALTAEDALVKAENALIRAASALTGIEVGEVYLESRRKYLDILLGACIKKAA